MRRNEIETTRELDTRSRERALPILHCRFYLPAFASPLLHRLFYVASFTSPLLHRRYGNAAITAIAVDGLRLLE